ncbi:Ig domain-containing protein [Acholeplasma equirhinis]|uniref:Ig-like domain-containing protein n=1 Tax=Acholeplasma equirhinis TaxID=555393 RepID=UPI00197AFCE8|nr:Ig-like domain-containing protein [Acholeplasma equirhinis]MBN3489887.1 Ig domain-containing protein [Acholeplasma equirhinis]
MKYIKKVLLLSLFTIMSFFVIACEETPNGGDPIEEGSVSLNYNEISIIANASSTSMLVAILDGITGTPVWSSSNEEVATVTPDTNPLAARVKGLKAGTATITVTVGIKTATCIVSVSQGEYLEIITKTISMQVGQTESISVDAHTNNITYTSNNELIAIVSASGVVTGISEGTTIITVKAGTKTGYVTVIVAEPGIEIIEPGDVLLQLDSNNEATLTARGLGGVNAELGTWTIEDDTVASITQEGAKVTITALETGVGKSTTVTFTIDGFEPLTRTVTVKDIDLEIDLDVVFMTMLKDQQTAKLTATLTPEQQGEAAEIIWTVNPVGIITVAPDGTISRVEGYTFTDDEVSVSVTATSKRDPEAKISAIVVVESPTKGIKNISTKEEFLAVFSNPANGSATITLLADIDLGGQTFASQIMAAGTFSGHFNGNGYAIKNFTAPGVFGVVTGTIENLAVIGKITGMQRGLIAIRTEQSGIIRNLYIDITHPVSSDETAAIGLFGSASFVIIISRNEKNDNIRTHAGFVQTGTVTNVFNYNAQNSVSTKGAITKTESEIKAASTYADWDTSIWNIVDGEIPTLIKK